MTERQVIPRREEPIAKKVYYSIGEVCDLTGLKPHVLRYWETQFDVLNPTKNRAGNRVYRSKEIELVLLVKTLLYDEKYTIEGANQKLLDMRRDGGLKSGGQSVVGPEFLAGIRSELEDLRKVLTPGSPGSPAARGKSGHSRKTNTSGKAQPSGGVG